MYRQSVHGGGKVFSPTHRPPLSPRRYLLYSFLLEVESTPGPMCGRKVSVNEKSLSNPRPSGLQRNASTNRATAHTMTSVGGQKWKNLAV